MIDADKPNTLCNTLRELEFVLNPAVFTRRRTDETDLRLQIVDDSCSYLHVENVTLVTQLNDRWPCKSVQQYS